MKIQQSQGGGARGVLPLKGKNCFNSSGEGFTLAEVLITLGIIGVVAAMTLPTLIQNHNKKVVETRLMKFYSTMNQAIQLAEVDYGERETWYAKYDDLDTDIKGRPVTGKSYREKWFNKYLAPYMKIVATNYDIAGDENPVFIFADGSGVRYRGDTSIADWYYYISNPAKCAKIANSICSFAFLYSPLNANKSSNFLYSGRTFEPYKYGWDGTVDNLYNNPSLGCNNGNIVHEYCAALIQFNGWRIPDDYPFKVKY